MVDGHPAWVDPPPDSSSDLDRYSVYVELDGSTVGLMSTTLAGFALLVAAGELDLDTATFDPADGTERPRRGRVVHRLGRVVDDAAVPHRCRPRDRLASEDEAGDRRRLLEASPALPVPGGHFAQSGLGRCPGGRARSGSSMVIWQESPSTLVRDHRVDTGEEDFSLRWTPCGRPRPRGRTLAAWPPPPSAVG